jgi:hypothetical protein
VRCTALTFELAEQLAKDDEKLPRLPKKISTENTLEPDKLTFPNGIIDGLAGFYADLYGTVMESPREFLYFAFLTCLGSVLSNRLTLDSELSVQPRLYTVLLGESADDRKSTACTKTIQLFKAALTDFSVCYGTGSAEGLANRIEGRENGDKVATGDGRLLLHYDEFKSFVSKSKLDGSVLLPMVNTLFELNTYENTTKHRRLFLENAHLSLLCASTVATYENTWSSQFTDIGFNNRLFLVPGSGRKQFSIPQRVPEMQRRLIMKHLGPLLSTVGNGMMLQITRDAHNIFHNWYLNLERSIHTKRLDTYALRLMPLLAANERKDAVDVEIVEKACKIMNWQLEVRKVHDPIDADNSIARMEEKVRRCLRRRPMGNRELKQFCNAKQAGMWFLETALKNLRKAGEITWGKGEKQWRLEEV